MRTVSLVLVAVSFTSAQDPVNTLGKAQMNAQFATLWSQHAKPMVVAQVTNSIQGLANKFYDQGNTKIWTGTVSNIGVQIDPAPGFEKLDFTGFQFRLPLAGVWKIQFKAKMKVKQKVAFFWVTKNFDATVTVNNLWARAKATIDASNPDAPKLSQVSSPEVKFNLTLSTNQWYLNLLYLLFKPQLDQKVKQAVDGAIASLMPALTALQGGPTLLGTGGPGVADPVPFDYQTPAEKISQIIQQRHLPWKTLIPAYYQTQYYGTWEESWNVDPGPLNAYVDWGDSACWTGHALAAESFRYKVTGSPQAKQMALTMLDGITQLAHMKGVPGWLNRCVIPAAAAGNLAPTDFVVNWNGIPHVISNGISRDQYMGVFFGLATAYDFIDDPAVKAQCKFNIEDMIDHLLEKKWTVNKYDGSLSTAWAMNFVQQLAWIHAARRVHPSKYASTYLQHAPLADLCWFTPWLETFDPVHSYYKFNLQHGSYFTFLRLENNPVLWQRGYKGFRILRRALRHHLQAHFNVCAAGIVPSQASTVASETRTLLRLFLKRPRRDAPVTVTGVETIVYNGPGVATDGTPPAPETIAKVPLPPDKRPVTDFLWQRHPFQLSSGGYAATEFPGVDYILPYWMGRYYGVFPN